MRGLTNEFGLREVLLFTEHEYRNGKLRAPVVGLAAGLQRRPGEEKPTLGRIIVATDYNTGKQIGWKVKKTAANVRRGFCQGRFGLIFTGRKAAPGEFGAYDSARGKRSCGVTKEPMRGS